MNRGCACAGEQRGAGFGHWAAGHGTRRDVGLLVGPGTGLHGGHDRDPFGQGGGGGHGCGVGTRRRGLGRWCWQRGRGPRAASQVWPYGPR